VDSGILSYLQDDRGWLFWAGAAAMAAGASLLLAVAVWNALRAARRLRAAPGGRTDPGRRNRGAHEGYDGLAWRKTAPVQAQPAPAPRGPEADTVRAEGLAAMLRRLRGAADQLEEMAERTTGGRPPDGESDLKAMGCDVEYVFRASGP
jgi:hypothetical protein